MPRRLELSQRYAGIAIDYEAIFEPDRGVIEPVMPEPAAPPPDGRASSCPAGRSMPPRLSGGRGGRRAAGSSILGDGVQLELVAVPPAASSWVRPGDRHGGGAADRHHRAAVLDGPVRSDQRPVRPLRPRPRQPARIAARLPVRPIGLSVVRTRPAGGPRQLDTRPTDSAAG
jgi:hypothetical protein